MGQGFKRKTYKLKWPEGHQLHGLEVVTKGLSLEKTFELASMAKGIGAEAGTDGKVKIAGELIAGFAPRLVSWNLEEEDGTPVPTTPEAIAEQDMPLVLGVITDWIDAVSSVDIPLASGSKSGPPEAPEASLPTESLSPSPQS